jgi:RNA polymerase sigma-70 factor (ECF subfamily)
MMEASRQIAFEELRLTGPEDAASLDARFAALVSRQTRFVFRVAYSVLRNTHDAEDVVQETFLKLYRGRRWQGIVDERAFLARTAWRMAVDRLPKVQVEATDSGVASRCDDPEQAAIHADWNAKMERLIEALPEELRLPLALSSVERMNSHEIAAVMGIPEGTVRTRMMRAREILKQKVTALMKGRHGR